MTRNQPPQPPHKFRLSDIPAWVQIGVVIAMGVAFAARTEARVSSLESTQDRFEQAVIDVSAIKATVDITAKRVERIDSRLDAQADADREERFRR